MKSPSGQRSVSPRASVQGNSYEANTPQNPSLDGILITWGDRLFYPGNRIIQVRPQPKLGASAAALTTILHSVLHLIAAGLLFRHGQASRSTLKHPLDWLAAGSTASLSAWRRQASGVVPAAFSGVLMCFWKRARA